MISLALFHFGSLKTAGMKEVAGHYHLLSQSWIRWEEYELKPTDGKQPLFIKQTQETHLLESKKKSTGWDKYPCYLLDERGKAQSSQEWATFFGTLISQGKSRFVFCLGSASGFSEELRKKHFLFSFGPQTLSHELARLVLFEQMYRTMTLLFHHPYHK